MPTTNTAYGVMPAAPPDVSDFEPIDAKRRAEEFKTQANELRGNWERETERLKRQIADRQLHRNLALEAQQHHQQIVTRLDREIDTLSRAYDSFAATHELEDAPLEDTTYRHPVGR
jgi:CHAT domain-containing protein